MSQVTEALAEKLRQVPGVKRVEIRTVEYVDVFIDDLHTLERVHEYQIYELHGDSIVAHPDVPHSVRLHPCYEEDECPTTP